MQPLAHTIAEKHHERWSAWFSGVPEIVYGGQSPADAIERLLEAVSGNQFDVDQLSAVDDATRDDHLDFRTPYRERRRIPEPSMN